jgi:nitrogen fixation NifU-like protein
MKANPQPDRMAELTHLYREVILRHAREPVGRDREIEATHRHESHNPQCGDRVRVSLRVENGRIAEAAFEGEACAICLASASLLCAHAPGNPVSHLLRWHQQLQEALSAQGDHGPEPTDDCPPFLRPLLGVRRYPGRVRCATLAWSAAAAALSPDKIHFP